VESDAESLVSYLPIMLKVLYDSLPFVCRLKDAKAGKSKHVLFVRVWLSFFAGTCVGIVD
jgi:hypothetical protein